MRGGCKPHFAEFGGMPRLPDWFKRRPPWRLRVRSPEAGGSYVLVIAVSFLPRSSPGNGFLRQRSSSLSGFMIKANPVLQRLMNKLDTFSVLLFRTMVASYVVLLQVILE